MSDSAEERNGFVKGADFLVGQLLPAQLDLLQSFLPMDYWMVGRQEGQRFDIIVTHGDAGDIPTAHLLEALEADNQFSDKVGMPDYRPGPNIYRTGDRPGVTKGHYPKSLVSG